MAKPGEVHGNIEVCCVDDDELAVREFLPAIQKLQSILARGDIDAFVGLSSERFLNLLWKRYDSSEWSLSHKTPPRKSIREFWRAALRSNEDPEGMHRLFSIKNEWKDDSWWQMTYELPQKYKGKTVPAFSVIVCFNKENRGPFRHVAFTLIKEDGKYRLADYDADWEDIGGLGPFQAREYGY
jgi:hypothetical protein